MTGVIATSSQLHTLRHMLGINTPYDDRPRPTRNYAAVEPDDPEFLALERAGWVKQVRRPWPAFQYDVYRCTDEGTAIAMASHRTIRRSAAARRYHRYLDLVDAIPDLTFGEFLQNKMYQEYDPCAPSFWFQS